MRFTRLIILLLLLCIPVVVYGDSYCIDCGGDGRMPDDTQVCNPGTAPSDGQVLEWSDSNQCWDAATDNTGSGGSAIVLDLGNNGADESADLNEIATSGDTNSIFTEPSADKLLIDLSNNWPTADNATTADALSSNPTDCSANQFANTIAANGNLTCTAITDADVPDTITVDLASAATALAANPTDCSANQFANTIAANGNLTCAAIADADVPNNITIDLAATATALAANPDDCSAGQYANAIAASGNLSCAAVAGSQVSFTPAGDIAATDVQAAIEELDSEKQAAGTYAELAFTTMNAPSGTDPVADTATDTLNFTVNSPGIAISGDSGTDTLQFQIVYTNTLAGNPALGQNACVFSNEGNGGGFLCEGSVNDTNESLFLFPDLTGSDSTRTIALTPASSTEGNCAEFDANGQVVDAGAACGGSFSLTVEESDDNPTVADVDTIQFNASHFTVADETGGQVQVNSILSPLATALAANPNDCSANNFATAIAANGDLTCSTIAITDLSDVTAISGNTSTVATTSGTLNSGNCVEIDASGNLVDAGGACGSGSGDIAAVGSCTTGSCAIEGGNDMFPFVYEGTANTEETTFSVTDPTADRAIVFPDAGGDVVLDTATQTLTNKTLTAANNTIGADTAVALASDPTDCSSNEFATAIAASGNLTCAALIDADIPDTITASNYLPLAGGTLTGLLTTDNLGIEFEDSDTNPTCSAGNYNLYADLSETAMKVCNNGTAEQIVTPNNTVTLTNKTISGASNTVTNIDDDQVLFDDANGDFSASTIGAAIEELVSSNGSGPNAANGKVNYTQLVDVPAFRKTLMQLRPQGYEPPPSSFATMFTRNGHPGLSFDGDVCAMWTFVMPNWYGGNGVTVDLWIVSSETSNDTDWDGSWERIATTQDIDSDSFATAISADNNNNNATSGIPTKVSIAFTDGAQMDSCAADELCRFRVCRDATSDTGGTTNGQAVLIGGQIRETP